MCVLSDIDSMYEKIMQIDDSLHLKKQVSASDLARYEVEVRRYENEFNDSQIMRELPQALSPDQYDTYIGKIRRMRGTVKKMKESIINARVALERNQESTHPPLPTASPSVVDDSLTTSSSASSGASSSSSDSLENKSPWELMQTMPQSADDIRADNDQELAFLRAGFNILATGDDAASLRDLLNDDKDMLSVKDHYGQNLFHYAVYKGYCETTKLLIKSGISQFEQTASGIQGVHIAVLQGHTDCLNVLTGTGQFAIELPVKIKICEQVMSVTSLHLAILSGQIKLIDQLLKSYPGGCPLRVESQLNVLHLAVYANDPAMLTFLLNYPQVNKGDDFFNERDKNGDAPVHLAIKLGYRNCIEVLLQCSKVDKTQLNKNKLNPFQLDAMLNPETSPYLVASITSMSLRSEEQIDDLIATKILPPGLLELDLSDSNLGMRTNDELLGLMKALPQSLQSLILSKNGLYKKTGVELLAIIQELPQGLQSLVLNWNFLSKKTGAELLAMTEALPGGLHSLGFANSGLGNKTSAEGLAIINALPKGLKSLDLGRNALGNKITEELLAIIERLPKGLHTLHLDNNSLGSKTVEELGSLFHVVPPEVRTLALGGNDLGSKTTEELLAIIERLPKGLHALHLDNNSLGSKTVEELGSLFHVVPPEVRTLALGENDLGNKTTEELLAIIGGLPKELHSLYLDQNFLGTKPVAELLAIFKVLPSGLHTLFLSWDDLNSQKENELIEILQFLQEQKQLELKFNGYFFPNAKVKKIYDDFFGKEILHSGLKEGRTIATDALNEQQPVPRQTIPASNGVGSFSYAASSNTIFRPEPQEPLPASSHLMHRGPAW